LKVDAMGLMDEGKLGSISAELQCQARQGFPGTVMLVKVAQLDCLIYRDPISIAAKYSRRNHVEEN
jgi:hypothetical protein